MEDRAVVDQIVDGRHAVLLVGESEVERIVSVDLLPPEVKEGTWLRVVFDGDQLVRAEIDAAATEAARARIAEKLNRLRARGRGER